MASKGFFRQINMTQLGCLLTSLLMTLSPCVNFAAINTRTFIRAIGSDKEIDLQVLNAYHSEFGSKAVDLTPFIPTNMAATNNEVTVASEILGHALDNLARQYQFDSETAATAARMINNTVTATVEYKADSGTRHKMGFDLKAGNTSANIKYEGLVKANFSYLVASNTVKFEITKRLNQSAELVFDHTDSQHTSENVGIRWTW